jgi:ribonuclease HI
VIKRLFEEKIHLVYHDHRKIFTDGSKTDNSTSAAIFEFNPQHEECTVKMKFTKNHSIFTAECYGVLKALKHFQHSHEEEKKLCIVVDSLSVLMAIDNFKNTYKSHPIVGKIIECLSQMIENRCDIKMLWVPSHCGILGNECADELANEAHEDPEMDIDMPYIFQDYSEWIFKQEILQKWQTEWNESDKGRYCHSILPNITKNSWYKSSTLTRQEIVFWNRIITNHTRSRQSLFRFGITDNQICDCAKNYQTVDHILFECEITSDSEMKNNLKELGWKPPLFIRDIIASEINKKEKTAMKIISEKMVKKVLEKKII